MSHYPAGHSGVRGVTCAWPVMLISHYPAGHSGVRGVTCAWPVKQVTQGHGCYLCNVHACNANESLASRSLRQRGVACAWPVMLMSPKLAGHSSGGVLPAAQCVACNASQGDTFIYSSNKYMQSLKYYKHVAVHCSHF